MSRRYIHISHYYDRYEVLVDGSRILRIHKLFADSGLIKQVQFEDLPDGIKDQIINEMDSNDYEI
jgi:hypothetical protein